VFKPLQQRRLSETKENKRKSWRLRELNIK